MPRPSKEAVFEKILTAVVDVVAKKGIAATSVGDVAKAARISAGTIYLHFENKDDMLQKVYLRIKADFHAELMTAANAGTSEQVIAALWLSFLGFLKSHPQRFLYLEYAGAAQVLTDAQRAIVAPYQAEINALVQTALDDGTLRPMPLEVATTLLIGPAMQLARKAALTGQAPSNLEITATFEHLWAGLAQSQG